MKLIPATHYPLKRNLLPGLLAMIALMPVLTQAAETTAQAGSPPAKSGAATPGPTTLEKQIIWLKALKDAEAELANSGDVARKDAAAISQQLQEKLIEKSAAVVADANLSQQGKEAYAAMPEPVQAYAAMTAGLTQADLDSDKPNSTPTPRLAAFYFNLGQYEKQKAAAAAGEKTAEAKPKADAEGKKPNLRIPEELLLRRAGVSLSLGAGTILTKDGDDASVGTLIVRWNLIQSITTARWNHLHPPGSRSEHVQYWGRSQEELIAYKFRDISNTALDREKLAERLEFPWWKWTAVGPFIGSAAMGEKVTVLDDGEEKEERPYLVGLSAGFGFYDKAGSLVYIDAGRTISPHTGFSDSAWYVGISADGEVLGSIFDWLRGKSGTGN